MISPEVFYNTLLDLQVDFFTGVPDSLLNNFCSYVDDNCENNKHITAANEGNAIALAAGYYLATGKFGAVYMQNSGLGNTVNPLTSLTDKEVYKIPMLLIIGWRGEPGIKDEPQHIKQGKVTEDQLRVLEVPYFIVDSSSDISSVIKNAIEQIREGGSPVALLVKKNTFSSYKSKKQHAFDANMKREDALRHLLKLTCESDIVVSTTGKTSRELFELRLERGELPNDFLTVGAMGHTSSIALGVALGNKEKRIICIDGDGSALMHLGAMPIIGSLKPSNFVHILLNNSAHESVGGQATVAGNLDFQAIAYACGYRRYYVADDVKSLQCCMEEVNAGLGPILFELRIATGSRGDLGRPTNTPQENKQAFMEKVSGL